ncbi:E3 ubiquitin-protein ligase WAVH1 [Bienertia sinuspersici]
MRTTPLFTYISSFHFSLIILYTFSFSLERNQEMGINDGEISASSKLKKAAKKFLLLPCATLCCSVANTVRNPTCNVGQSHQVELCSPARDALNFMLENGDSVSSKNVCSICLEPLLNNKVASSPGKAIFTSQCCHSFHLSCISSNIQHGSMTCPVCRSQWTHLPRTLHPPCWLLCNQDDPIIDDSISTFGVYRQAIARYNDHDLVEPEIHSTCHQRLHFRLIPLDVPQTPSPSPSNCWSCVHYSSLNPYLSPGQSSYDLFYGSMSPYLKRKRATYLSVRLAPQHAIDLVLVATPNGPHLRVLKQLISQVVYSLRPVDRLAIVCYSLAAAHIFPLQCMTPLSKRAALEMVHRLFYAGHVDPVEGIRKGIKILKDRAYQSPFSSILHLSVHSTSSRHYRAINEMEVSMSPFISVHQFHVVATNSIMHELDEFLGRLLNGTIQEVQLMIGNQDDARIVRLGEIRGDEERRVVLEVDESHEHICIGYSYVEGSHRNRERVRVGENTPLLVGEQVVLIIGTIMTFTSLGDGLRDWMEGTGSMFSQREAN